MSTIKSGKKSINRNKRKSNMDGIVIIGILAAAALIAAAAKPSQSKILGMEDTPVSIENIRRGVANGWYDCVLIRVDGKPAVRLSGKTTSGKFASLVLGSIFLGLFLICLFLPFL